MSETADEVLRRVFGHAGFRGPQGDVVDALVRGEDCLVLMPTGAGKSVCYQVPALLRDGTAIVVSPLIALMQDQVDAPVGISTRQSSPRTSASTTSFCGPRNPACPNTRRSTASAVSVMPSILLARFVGFPRVAPSACCRIQCPDGRTTRGPGPGTP